MKGARNCAELCDLDVYSGYNVYHHTDGAVVVIHGNNHDKNYDNNHGNHHGKNQGNNHGNNQLQSAHPTHTTQVYPRAISPSTELAENLRLQPDGSRSPSRKEEAVSRSDVSNNKRKANNFSCSGTFTELCSKFRSAYQGVSKGVTKSNESGVSSPGRNAEQDPSLYCQCRWNSTIHSNRRNTRSDDMDKSYRVASARHYIVPDHNDVREPGRLKTESSPGCYSSWTDPTRPPYPRKRTSSEDRRGRSCFLGLDHCGEDTKRTAVCRPVQHEPRVIRDLYFSSRSDFRSLKRGRGRRHDQSGDRRHYSSNHYSVLPSPPEPYINYTTRSVPLQKNRQKSNNTVTFDENLVNPNLQQTVSLKGRRNCASTQFLESTGKTRCVSCESLPKQNINFCGTSSNQIGQVDAHFKKKSRSTGDIANKLENPDKLSTNVFNERGCSCSQLKTKNYGNSNKCAVDSNHDRNGVEEKSDQKKLGDLNEKKLKEHLQTLKAKENFDGRYRKESTNLDFAKLDESQETSNLKEENLEKDQTQRRHLRNNEKFQDSKKLLRDKTNPKNKEKTSSENVATVPSTSSSTSSGIIIGGSSTNSLSGSEKNINKDQPNDQTKKFPSINLTNESNAVPKKGKSKLPKNARSKTGSEAPKHTEESLRNSRPKKFVQSPSRDNHKPKLSSKNVGRSQKERPKSTEIHREKKGPKKKSIRSSSSSSSTHNGGPNRNKSRSPDHKRTSKLPKLKKADLGERKTKSNNNKNESKKILSKKLTAKKPPFNPERKQGKVRKSSAHKERKDSPNDTYYEISEIFDSPDSDSGSSVYIDDDKEGSGSKIGVQSNNTNLVLSKSKYSTSDLNGTMKDSRPLVKQIKESTTTNGPLVPPPRSKKHSKLKVEDPGDILGSEYRERRSSKDFSASKEEENSKGYERRAKRSFTSKETKERPFNITNNIHVVTNENGRHCKSCEPIRKKLNCEYCSCKNGAKNFEDTDKDKSIISEEIRKGKSPSTNCEHENAIKRHSLSSKFSNKEGSEEKPNLKSRNHPSSNKISENKPKTKPNTRQHQAVKENTTYTDMLPKTGSGDDTFISITGSGTDLEMKSAVMTPDLTKSVSELMMSCCDDLDEHFGVVSTPLPTDNNNDKLGSFPVVDDESFKEPLFGNMNSRHEENELWTPQIVADQVQKINRAANSAVEDGQASTLSTSKEDREDSEDEVGKAPSNTSDPTIDRDIQTPINKSANLESGTKAAESSGEQLPTQENAAQRFHKVSTNTDTSHLSIKESSSSPASINDEYLRRSTDNGNKKSPNPRTRPGHHRSRHRCCCRPDRRRYCSYCAALDCYSDQSESRKVKSKRCRREQKYSSDSETSLSSRNVCCHYRLTDRELSKKRIKRMKLFSSCKSEFSKDKPLKSHSPVMKTPITQNQENSKEGVLSSSGPATSVDDDKKSSKSAISFKESKISPENQQADHSQSPKSSTSPTRTRRNKNIVPVCTPDLSDAESVFIGSTSSESERKATANCKSCCRASSPMSDAPFLKIALALEKYLESQNDRSRSTSPAFQTSDQKEPSITVLKQLVSTGTLTEPVFEEKAGNNNIVKQWKKSTHQQKQLAKKNAIAEAFQALKLKGFTAKTLLDGTDSSKAQDLLRQNVLPRSPRRSPLQSPVVEGDLFGRLTLLEDRSEARRSAVQLLGFRTAKGLAAWAKRSRMRVAAARLSRSYGAGVRNGPSNASSIVRSYGTAAGVGSYLRAKLGSNAGDQAAAGEQRGSRVGSGVGSLGGNAAGPATSLEEHKCASCGFIQRVNVDQIDLDISGEMDLSCSHCSQKMFSFLSIALKLVCIACGVSYEEGDCCSGCGGLSMRRSCEVTCVGCGSVEQIQQNLMRTNAGGLLVARCISCIQILLVKASHLERKAATKRTTSVLGLRAAKGIALWINRTRTTIRIRKTEAAQKARLLASSKWEKQTCLSCNKQNRIDLETVRMTEAGNFAAKCGFCSTALESGLLVSKKFFCTHCGNSGADSNCSVCETDQDIRVDFEVSCLGCGSVQQMEEALFERNSKGLLVARCQPCTLVTLFVGSGEQHLTEYVQIKCSTCSTYSIVKTRSLVPEEDGFLSHCCGTCSGITKVDLTAVVGRYLISNCSLCHEVNSVEETTELRAKSHLQITCRSCSQRYSKSLKLVSLLLTFGPLNDGFSTEQFSKKSAIHSFNCPFCSQLNELDQTELRMSGKTTGNTYCSKCSRALSLDRIAEGVSRRFLCSCILCGASNEFLTKEVRGAGHKHYLATCKECREEFQFYKWAATNLLHYPNNSIRRGHKGPELQRTESNVGDGDTNIKLVEVTEICDCSDCETSSTGSLSQPSETLSLEKETAPEPKTVDKWRELFGKTEIESTDIFDFYKDAPPERLGAQRPINTAADIVGMMMYHLDSIFSTAGLVSNPPQ
ncbi:hypothetical protein ACHWQZ_G019056 [Mnemiopsis leidyi]